jgi:hypothetical protein
MSSNRPVGVTILGTLMALGGLLSLTILLIPGAVSSTTIMLFVVGPGVIQLALGLGFFKGYSLSWWVFGFASVGLVALFITVGILSLSIGAPSAFLGIPAEGADPSGSLIESIEALFVFGVTGIVYAYILSNGVRAWFSLEQIQPKRAILIHFGIGIISGLAVYFGSLI